MTQFENSENSAGGNRKPSYVLIRHDNRNCVTNDTDYVYRMKTPWRNGATHVVMERIELIQKLPPRSIGARAITSFTITASWRPPRNGGVTSFQILLRQNSVHTDRTPMILSRPGKTTRGHN